MSDPADELTTCLRAGPVRDLSALGDTDLGRLNGPRFQESALGHCCHDGNFTPL
jgi:hypothetical protein